MWVHERTAGMMQVIDEESVNLKRYQSEVASLEGETEDVVGAVTYLNFNRGAQSILQFGPQSECRSCRCHVG